MLKNTLKVSGLNSRHQQLSHPHLSRDPGLVRSRMWGLLLLVCGAAPVLGLLLLPPDWLEVAALAVPNAEEDVSC